MIIAEIILFLCLALSTSFFVRQAVRYSKVNLGYKLLTIGMCLISLNALLDVFIIGPTVLFPQIELPYEIARVWDVAGYLPGIIGVLIGMFMFLPSVALLSQEVEDREQEKQSLQSQADDLQSAKMRAEDAEKFLFEALETISEAFIIFDKNDRVVAYNSRYRELFESVGAYLKPGVTFEELIRRQAKQLGIFEDEAALEEWIQRRLEEHNNPVGTKEQVFETGEIYRLSEVKTPSGGTVAIRTNITDLRTREKALRILNERLQEAQSVAHIGHWSYDVKNERHDWSDEVSRIMGYDPNTLEITTNAYLDRVHPDDMDRMRSLVRWAQQNDENYQIDYRMVRPNGEIVYVREIGRVQKDSSGQTEFFRGTIQDISAQHQTEMELMEAKVRAEEGTRAKSLFLANMSHELRTPLNAIIGFAEVITKEIFGPINNNKYKEYSDNILSSGQHLLSLINDILDFSRLEADKHDLEETDISLYEVVKWTELLLNSKAMEKKISLTHDIPQDLIMRGDERKIKQVLINLTNNAIKFTPDGGKVRLYAEMTGPEHYSLFVEDNGIGIDAKELETVLKPFVRTMNAVSSSVEGTGLGLPLSKSIVELHGGKLLLTSQVGKGTKVEIQFPRNRFQNFAKSA
ncbi:ATP-binding protein [Sneathiella limimaris]|uniref:PAS domain-containing sensor histidine kinase n=1 Tax=Sneathiella limimaris TaxID=1964213 RepID=UPI00146E95ED|nr:ATP-binding protein [Sneathiella limimaris]